MIDILERFLQQINLHRNPINRITYNVVSSTMASEYIRSMEGKSADCDSMILISLCYGKQVGVSEARGKEESASADGLAGSACDDEVMLNDVVQLKHLVPYDLGLTENDCAYHSPLLAFAQLKVFKNMRIRSKESEDRRRARWGDLNESYKEKRDDRRAERKERKDSVPPLRRDSFKDLDTGRSRSVSRVSRSVSRVSSRDLSTRRPNPPPRIKAAPAFLKPAPSTVTGSPPVKAPPVPPPRPARSPSADRPVATRTVGTSSKTPPWREREQRQYIARGRERSQTPVERNTRTRTETRSSTGASWTNTRRDRDRPVGVPEPPPPPTRIAVAKSRLPRASVQLIFRIVLMVNIISSLTTVQTHERTMLSMFLCTLYHALDGFKHIMVIG